MFLLLAGAILVTGATLAGVMRATGAGVAGTGRALRAPTRATAGVRARRRRRPRCGRARRRRRSTGRAAADPSEPEPLFPPEPDTSELVIRATHVEAPPIEGATDPPELDDRADDRSTPGEEPTAADRDAAAGGADGAPGGRPAT